MIEVLSAAKEIAEVAVKESVGKTIELPEWLNKSEPLKDINSFEQADRPLHEIGREGGSYRDVRGAKDIKEGFEVHHIPSKSSYDNIHPNDGPAIRMDAQDHRETASWGYSRESIQYRNEQRSLISEGRFKEAQQLDIDDIRSKFDSKYDVGIEQAKRYSESKGYM